MTTTLDTAAITRQITQETGALRRAISRAELDLSAARHMLDAGGRPGGSLGRVLSQSAMDVDLRASRLNALLDVAGAFVSEAEMQQALADGVRTA